MRKVLSTFVAICLVLSLFAVVPSAQADTSGDYQYAVAGGNATITKYIGSGGAVIIPSTLGGYPVTRIGDYAFKGCTSLSNLTIGPSVTSIGGWAFYSCTSLPSVTIPNSVTSIGGWAFYSCTSLSNLTIGPSVTSIGDWAFYGCTSLSNLTIGSGLHSIGNWAFYGCTSLSSVTIPNSVTSILEQAFGDCTLLSNVDIGSGLHSIGDWAFAGCTSLSNLTIGPSVTSIGDIAFNGCTSLSSVTIPNSVTSIGDGAFDGCSSLTAASFLGNAPAGTTHMFGYCHSGFTVYYLSGTTGWTNPWYGYPTATFTSPYTFTFTVNVFGSGSVAKSPDAASYPSGTVVTLTATPAIGYAFTGWSGDLTGTTNPTTITMDANKTVTATFAKTPTTKQSVLVLHIGKSSFTVNGTSKTLDSPPVIKNGRTLVPIRAIIEALGGTVGWDGTARKATVTLGSTSLELWIGRSSATVNGAATPIDSTNAKVVPEIINGRTMLPLRFVTENLGAMVGWDQSTQTITITYQP